MSVDHAPVTPAVRQPRQFGAIVARALAERWRSLVWWSVGLAGMCAVQLAVYPSVRSSSAGLQEMVDAWPEALREAFSLEDYASGAGFLNAELFSMMFPLVLTAVALGFASGATAGEEERGTADVLLALPVRRWLVLAAKATAMVLGVVAVAVIGLAAILVGAPMVNLDVGAGGIVAAGVMTVLLALFFGAVGLLVGAVTGSRAASLGAGTGLAIAAFLLNALAPLADWLEPWQKVSPFYWALHTDALTDGLSLPMALVLLAGCAVLAAAAVTAFRRHDVESR